MERLLSQILFSNDVIIYISIAMLIAFGLSFVDAGKKHSNFCIRIRNSIKCTLFTYCFSLPIIQYWDTLPPATPLFIGSFIGAIGSEGLTELIVSLKKKLITLNDTSDSYIKSKLDDSRILTKSRPYKKPTSEYRVRPVHNEPPMPDDKRGGMF